MAPSMENLAHLEPDLMGPNRNHEVLTEADFHTKGELPCRGGGIGSVQGTGSGADESFLRALLLGIWGL